MNLDRCGGLLTTVDGAASALRGWNRKVCCVCLPKSATRGLHAPSKSGSRLPTNPPPPPTQYSPRQQDAFLSRQDSQLRIAHLVGCGTKCWTQTTSGSHPRDSPSRRRSRHCVGPRPGTFRPSHHPQLPPHDSQNEICTLPRTHSVQPHSSSVAQKGLGIHFADPHYSTLASGFCHLISDPEAMMAISGSPDRNTQLCAVFFSFFLFFSLSLPRGGVVPLCPDIDPNLGRQSRAVQLVQCEGIARWRHWRIVSSLFLTQTTQVTGVDEPTFPIFDPLPPAGHSFPRS